jgi:hypothetical protein
MDKMPRWLFFVLLMVGVLGATALQQETGIPELTGQVVGILGLAFAVFASLAIHRASALLAQLKLNNKLRRR